MLAALLLLAAAPACAGGASTGDKGYISSTGITQLPIADRKKLGAVEGVTLQGEKVALSQFAGKVVVLNVWASWCGPCRKEAPVLAAAARALKSEGVAFVGINNRDSSRDQGLAFERRYGVPYPSLFDPSGHTLLAFRGTLNPNAMPSTVVIDQRGRVAARILDAVTSKQTLIDLVQDLL